MKVVNLSSRPFVNERPVVRLSVALWVLGGLLLAMNLYSYSNYWFDSEEIRGELAELRSAIDKEEKEFDDLRAKAAQIDLAGLNDRAFLLNKLIRYRTFPWSRLFDDLEEVLPFDVRLRTVQPDVEFETDVEPTRSVAPRRTSRRRSSRDPAAPPAPVEAPKLERIEEIPMSLQGFAKNEEAVLDLVDALFAHPSFRDPDFQRETLVEQTREVSFEIRVTYLLEFTEADTAEEEAVAEAGEEEAGEETEQASPRAQTADEARTADEAGTAGQTEQEALAEAPQQRGVPPSGSTAEGSGDRAVVQADPLRSPGRQPPAPTGAESAKPAPDPPAAPAGRPGSPAAGTTIATAPVFIPPAAGTPPPPVPTPAAPPSPPTRLRTLPDRPAPPPPGTTRPASDPGAEDEDPRVTPRFVEPDASGTTPLSGSGT